MSIWKKMNYTAQIPVYKGNIWEYDMTSAGFTMAKKSGLLTDEETEHLESLPKKERVIALGYLLRDDDKLLTAVENGIRNSISEFCKVNEIEANDIISIKRDAVFSTRKAEILEIDGTVFTEDNKYSSFFLFNKAELFWNTWDNIATWKGLGKLVVERDKNHFLAFMTQIIKSTEQGDARSVAIKLNNFRDKYIRFMLEKEYYRECNREGFYRHNKTLFNSSILTKAFPGFKNLNPIYNYREFILPLITILWKQS